MEKLTRRQTEALADYLTAAEHSSDREKLNEYLTAPAEKREEILAELWETYGHRVSVRAKL